MYGVTYNQLYTLVMIGLVVVLILSFTAQGKVKRTFQKYAQIPASSGIAAEQMAQQLLYQAGSSVTVHEVSGALTDHYNPKTAQVGLSNAVYGERSIAALAVAAHEIGHVMQYETGYTPIKIRNAILPVASLGSNISPYIVIAGVLFSWPNLAYAGCLLFAAMLLFQIVTLPVEYNASNRALAMLQDNGYITEEETPAAKRMLRAAGNTYVIAALASLVSLLRLILIAGNSRRRR